MKKKFICMLALGCLLCFALTNVPVKAGSIDGGEGSILAFMEQTFEIDGDIYAISGGYRSKAREYLSRDDVNISSGEAASYISAAKSDIYGGRAYAYLTKVGEVGSDTTESADDADVTVDGVAQLITTLDKMKNTTEVTTQDPTKVRVETSVPEGKVYVKDVNGDVLTVDMVIKNTGYSSSHTWVYVVCGLLVVLAGCVFVVYRFDLFAQDDEC